MSWTGPCPAAPGDPALEAIHSPLLHPCSVPAADLPRLKQFLVPTASGPPDAHPNACVARVNAMIKPSSMQC